MSGGWRYGAGRNGWRGKVEECIPLDIRHLARYGHISQKRCSWWPAPRPVGPIGLFYSGSVLTLHWGGEKDQASSTVKVTFTPCNFGGQRPWFECPACDRRCAILYFRASDAAFGCRTCLDLAYTAEALEFTYRLLWKQRKLERKLGRSMTRPKGMHRRTYDYLIGRIEEIDARRILLLRPGLDRLLRG